MTEEIIFGKSVVLRPATMADRRMVYDWAAHSDVTAAMMGPPVFPDHPVPTWEEFCADYLPHFFDGSAPELGRCYLIVVGGEAVGQVNSNDIEARGGVRRTEIDIWLRSEADCGRGYGPDAVAALCEHLARSLGVREFMAQPSARNPRSQRAFAKAGFTPLGLPVEQASALWGPSDYYDSVYMVRRVAG